ncbi:MAG: DUF429 domain-containing protein [Myxococcota bacterium]
MTEESRTGGAVVIGVDCAVHHRNVGLARVVMGGATRPLVEEVVAGDAPSWDAIDARILRWVTGPTLIALDAPLGWPAPLGEGLVSHRAGASLSDSAHAMFRRQTDDVVADRVGKRPLDVGADRIARTAHAALDLLARLRAKMGRAMPLAWSPGPVDEGVHIIEVYPAATLAARGLPSRGYKGSKPSSVAVRREIMRGLGDDIHAAPATVAVAVARDHGLDAVVCALAALDFMTASVIRPRDPVRAAREGWIWVRDPSRTGEDEKGVVLPRPRG